MTKPVSQKMGIQEGMRAFFKNLPETARSALSLPDIEVSPDVAGRFDYIHLFTTTQSELDNMFPQLKVHLKPTGMLWISWPKNK